jgi:hypothetical protein
LRVKDLLTVPKRQLEVDSNLEPFDYKAPNPDIYIYINIYINMYVSTHKHLLDFSVLIRAELAMVQILEQKSQQNCFY